MTLPTAIAIATGAAVVELFKQIAKHRAAKREAEKPVENFQGPWGDHWPNNP